MNIRIAQIRVQKDVKRNRDAIFRALDTAEPGDWVAFPEGALTGYFPEEADYLTGVRPSDVDEALDQIGDVVAQKQCCCLLGTARFEGGSWYNSVVVHSDSGQRLVYDKTNLYAPGMQHFQPGDELPVHTVDGVTFGIQICREIFFPEQWKVLRKKGAQIIFHINNAIKPIDSPWNHLLISRAIENQLFVCSVNNAASPQALASYLISPSGEVLIETDVQVEQTAVHSVDLSDVRSDFVEDERTDLVRLQFE